MAVALVALLLGAPAARARNLMSADGPGGTYELLRQAYTTELPDCGHMVPHITEELDDELHKNVFVFHAHVNLDDDRCGAKDRQRTEIRGKAPDIVANNGETVYYRWKFKLPTGFQGASSFTHIFQIKSDLGAPVMTLTPRTATLAIDGRIGARGTTNLSKFIGVWVVVDLKVFFSHAGRVEMTIKRLAGGEVLFSHAGAADTWDDNASAHDPKFGIYRSLNNRASLRDEQVRFADFCVSKQSASECDDGSSGPPSDAGASGPDAAAGGPDAKTGGPDPAEVGGTPAPPAAPDAAAGTAPADAKPATGPQPSPDAPPDDPGATAPGPRAGKSSGCSVGAASAGAAGPATALCLLACALGLWRRRRRA
jgi:hypothetical protein